MKIQNQKPAHHYRARLFQVYVILAALAFGILFFLARTAPYFAFDVPVAHAVQSISWGWFDWVMVWLTRLGAEPLSFLWTGVIVLALFLRGLRWEAVTSVLAAGGVTLLGLVVKDIVHRARPTPDLVQVFSVLTDYSFPSGHVLLFTAFLGFLIFLLYTLAPHSRRRTAGIIFVGIPIALISVSRVYLGEHWPSDTLGAYLLGSLWLALMIYVYRWGKRRKLLEA